MLPRRTQHSCVDELLCWVCQLGNRELAAHPRRRDLRAARKCAINEVISGGTAGRAAVGKPEENDESSRGGPHGRGISRRACQASVTATCWRLPATCAGMRWLAGEAKDPAGDKPPARTQVTGGSFLTSAWMLDPLVGPRSSTL